MLVENGLYLAGQEIYTLDRKLFGIEILLRHKDYKNIRNYIDNLSFSGKVEVFSYVFENAIDIAKCIPDEVKIFINLSSDLLPFVANFNISNKLRCRIVFEIIDDFTRERIRLKPYIKPLALRDFNFAFDDFRAIREELINVIETLNYLYAVKCDVDYLKMRDFVNTLKVLLACNQRLKVIVEYIETEEDFDFVREVVTSRKRLQPYYENFLVQGFYLSTPEKLQNVIEKLSYHLSSKQKHNQSNQTVISVNQYPIYHTTPPRR